MINERFLGMVLDSDIHNEYMGSDHCPISMTLSLKNLIPAKDTEAKNKKATNANKLESKSANDSKEDEN